MSSSRITSPSFLDVDTWRNVRNNNKRSISKVLFTIETEREAFIPQVLNDTGFFPSNSAVKKNQPSLWRNLTETETSLTIELSWCTILILTK